MRCRRCHGLMLVDSFIDLEDDRGHLWLRAWRCVNCGEMEEPGIAGNRLARRSRFALLLDRLARRAPRSSEPVSLGT